MVRSVSVVILIMATACLTFGQFKPAKYYRLGQKNLLSYQVITADFNNDGILDLAVADSLSNEVSVLLGNENGTFGNPIVFKAGFPVGISSGDMNGDGNQDLIVTESGGTGVGYIDIFLGDGTGHFKLFKYYKAGIEPFGNVVADFNGDGHLDVAVENAGNNGQGQSVMVYFGDGKGKLGVATSYSLPGGKSGGPSAIATGDLNGDGYLDLAVTVVDRRKNHLPYVAIMLNDGKGKFKISGEYFTGGGTPTSIAIANLKGDGLPDIAIGNESQSLGILLNTGGGKFGKTKVYPPCDQCGGPNVIVVADFNQDGILDIACVGNQSQKSSNGIFYGKGSGKFGTETSIPNVLGGVWITSGTFGHDLSPDLAISTGGNNVAILINKK